MPIDDRFEREQAARLQWIAAECHRERENELEHERPARDVRVQREQHWVQHEEQQDRALVPTGCLAEKCGAQCLDHAAGHALQHEEQEHGT